MVPFWVPIIIRHLLFRVPKGGLNFDNYPIRFGSRVRCFVFIGGVSGFSFYRPVLIG